MNDETSPGAPTAGAPAVPPPGDQAGATTAPSIETAPLAPAELATAPAPAPEPVVVPSDSATIPSVAAGESTEEAEGELHRLISNGLHIFGKIEHWTAEEIAAFVAWLESRL